MLDRAYWTVLVRHFEKHIFVMEPVEKHASFTVQKTEDDLDILLDMKDSSNTRKETTFAVNIFRSYCIKRQKPECFENFPVEELANTLRFFYAEVTKKGGENYKKSSFNCIREGIARLKKRTKH